MIHQWKLLYLLAGDNLHITKVLESGSLLLYLASRLNVSRIRTCFQVVVVTSENATFSLDKTSNLVGRSRYVSYCNC